MLCAHACDYIRITDNRQTFVHPCAHVSVCALFIFEGVLQKRTIFFFSLSHVHWWSCALISFPKQFLQWYSHTMNIHQSNFTTNVYRTQQDVEKDLKDFQFFMILCITQMNLVFFYLFFTFLSLFLPLFLCFFLYFSSFLRLLFFLHFLFYSFFLSLLFFLIFFLSFFLFNPFIHDFFSFFFFFLWFFLSLCSMFYLSIYLFAIFFHAFFLSFIHFFSFFSLVLSFSLFNAFFLPFILFSFLCLSNNTLVNALDRFLKECNAKQNNANQSHL